MHIDNESKFVFLLGQERLEGLSLGLGERLAAWEVGRAGIDLTLFVWLLLQPVLGDVLLDIVDLAEVDSEVPVQINSLVYQLHPFFAVLVLVVHILPLWQNLVFFFPALLDESDAIHVENGQEVVLVLLEEVHILLIFLNHSFPEKFENLVDVQ